MLLLIFCVSHMVDYYYNISKLQARCIAVLFCRFDFSSPQKAVANSCGGENCGHRITRVEGTEGKRRVSIALETNLVERRADTVRTFLRAEKCERRSIESMAIGNASESKRVQNAGCISNAS